MTTSLRLIAGRSNEPLAKEIGDLLGTDLVRSTIKTFPDGEIFVRLHESVRATDAFIIQSLATPVNDNLVELLLLIDAVKRASARSVSVVVPYLGYARQDRKTAGREPISAKVVANCIATVGADRIISIDMHAPQIQGFFDIPMDHLTSHGFFVNYLRSMVAENLAIVAPDLGRAKIADRIARDLDLPLLIMNKKRDPGTGQVTIDSMVGECTGKNCVLVDDIIASGSIIANVKYLESRGAASCRIMAAHPILSPESHKNLTNDFLEQIVVSNTVKIDTETREVFRDKLHVISIAPLLAEVIDRIFHNRAVSEVYKLYV